MLNTFKFRLISAVFISILLCLVFYAASYLEPSGFSIWLLPIFSFLMLTVWELSNKVSQWLDKNLPWSRGYLKRVLLQFVITSAGTIIAFNIPYSLFKWYSLRYLEAPGSSYSFFIVLLINSALLIFALLITGLQLNLYFIDKWKNSQLETETLKKEKVTAQYNALKSQLDPHFLFNNLNTLYGLIQESHELAGGYVLRLSDIYRYVLKSREEELVPITEEIDIARSYLFLLEKRYENALQIHWALDLSQDNFLIAPLTLQMLLENAIKHNVIRKEKPLHISITTSPGTRLQIKNSLQKRTGFQSTQLGLQQLKQRYHYLSDESIEVAEDIDSFSVSIPLLTIQ